MELCVEMWPERRIVGTATTATGLLRVRPGTRGKEFATMSEDGIISVWEVTSSDKEVERLRTKPDEPLEERAAHRTMVDLGGPVDKGAVESTGAHHDESQRLEFGPAKGQEVGGIGLCTYVLKTETDAGALLERLRTTIRTLASTRPRSSGNAGPGAASMTSSTPRSNGSIGSTTAGSSSRSATFHLQNSKKLTILNNTPQPEPLDSCKPASGNPGAVEQVSFALAAQMLVRRGQAAAAANLRQPLLANLESFMSRGERESTLQLLIFRVPERHQLRMLPGTDPRKILV
jgi:hypothetical protein